MEYRTADSVIADLKKIVSERLPLERDQWLTAAFYLAVLREDEAKKLNGLTQEVSKLKLAILKTQEKKNVAAAEIEVDTTDTFREMKDQEARLETIDQLIMVAKKNTDNY